MTTTMMLLMMTVTSTINPISMAASIMIASVLITPYLYKNLSSSWLPLILILTFSSGMMTLFMYTSSLASNETNKNKSSKMLAIVVMITAPTQQQKKTQTNMKFFSSQYALLIMATILIITLMALTTQSHNPHQTLTSSF